MDIFYFGEWLSVIEKYFRLREKNAAFRWTASDFERGKKRAAERPDDEKFSLDFKSARAFFEFFISIIIFYKKWREGKSLRFKSSYERRTQSEWQQSAPFLRIARTQVWKLDKFLNDDSW